MNFQPLQIFLDRLTAWRIPGNAISISLDGKEVFRGTSGFADKIRNEPMSAEHLLYLYSASKPATVTAALQLYEKGCFLLDDPLYDFLPAFREMTVRTANGEVESAKTPITLRHLFTMTSGMDYRTDTPALARAKEETNGRMDTRTVVKHLASEPLCFEPGTRWMYGLNHDVLAAVVEVVSGMRFCEYMQKHLFEPLGMEAYYHDDGLHDRMAEQYRYVNSTCDDLVELQKYGFTSDGGVCETEGKQNFLVFGPDYDSGGAGILTSVAEYAKFGAALARKGLGLNGERILSEGTVALLQQDQLNDTTRPYFDWPQYRGYGYGLGVCTLVDRALSGSTGHLGEFGWCGAAGACLLVDPSIGLSVSYAHHMLNPQEHIYMPRLRNVIYACLD